jgi:hypothetical protein
MDVGQVFRDARLENADGGVEADVGLLSLVPGGRAHGHGVRVGHTLRASGLAARDDDVAHPALVRRVLVEDLKSRNAIVRIKLSGT